MRKIITIALLLVALFQSSSAVAQDLLKSEDLSTVNVDYLSDDDITKIKTQLETNNLTIDQAEPMVLSKGMSANEFAKLKTRIEALATLSKDVVKTEKEPQKEAVDKYSRE
jgi:DNA polymerase III psi subunit